MKPMFLSVTLVVLCAAMSSAQTVPKNTNGGLNLSRVMETDTSESDLQIQEAQADYKSGEVALRSKDFVEAESDFRASLAIAPGEAYLGLAKALTAQGRIAEALQTYRKMFQPNPTYGFGGSYITRTYLNYALLLNQTGQWTTAVTAFQAALPTLPGGDLPKINVRFDPDIPQPVALAAAIHVALGLDMNFGGNDLGEIDHSLALSEYAKALQLAPNWDVANYYYGYGWQRLDRKDRAKFGSVQQAKAALQKAIKLGKGDVKLAAQKALKNFKRLG